HVGEDEAEGWIERNSVPVAAADRTRVFHDVLPDFPRIVRDGIFELVFIDESLAISREFRGDVLRYFRHLHADARDGLGLHRERLGWRRLFAGHGALRYRPLFHAENRFAVPAIEDIHQPRLAHVDDG